MDELLAKLLSSEVLTEEVKTEVATGFKALVEAAVVEATTKAEIEVRAQLTEQFVEERNALVEAVDTKVTEFLQAELTELKEDIDNFRDLEVEFAEKLVEARAELAAGLKGDMSSLIDTLDVFLEERFIAEMSELKESIEDVRKIEFGRNLFEAFATAYQSQHVDADGTQAALAQAKAELEAVTANLTESQKALKAVTHAAKLAEVLEPLSGTAREVMETVLKNTPTEKLEEAYQTFIPRVLHDATRVSEKENVSLVLAEGNEPAVEGVLVNGDGTPAAEEVVTESADVLARKARLRTLAGL